MIILLPLSLAMATQAQIMNVASIERLATPNDDQHITQAVAISPQGDYLLLSTDTKQGLVKWDFSTAASTTLTRDQGAGSMVSISDDGGQIVYSHVSYKNKRRYEAVKSIDITNGKQRTLVKPSRHLQGVALENKNVAVVKDNQVKFYALNPNATTATRPILSHHHLKLYITRDGVTTQLAPNGQDERYIWASLSPDASRVLYYVSGHGAFVCDIDGTHVIPMGNITAPKWWDDQTVVGMDEMDNEYSIVASSIVARTLDGRYQVLTSNDVIATYPQPSVESGKIVFSTPDGQVYMITVE